MSDTMTCKYGVIRKTEYMTEGAFVGTFKVMVEKMFHGAATAKGAIIITQEKVIVTPRCR